MLDIIGILMSTLLLIQTRKFPWIKVTFVLSLFFSFAQWYHFEESANIRKITIYNIAGRTAIDLMENGQVYFIADSVLKHEYDNINFHITSNRIRNGVRSVHSGEPLQKKLPGCSLMVWRDISILQIHDPVFYIPHGLYVDYVVVSNNAVTKLNELRDQLDAEEIYFR